MSNSKEYQKGSNSKNQEKKDPKQHTPKEANKDTSRDKKNGIPSRNDWSFYAASEQIAKDVASVAFNYLGGTPFLLTGAAAPYTQSNGYTALPSVMALPYVSSIGVTNSRTQGVNMAAVQLYTKVRHVNSGAKNYEAADLMMYVLAMRDIYATYFEAKKILGFTGLYNYYNHNLPDLIITSSLVDPNDLRENLAQYRARLNMLAKKINSFAVPKYFKVFERTTFINSYLFGDSSSIRGQFYNFRKEGDYTWSGTSSTSGTSLVFQARQFTYDTNLATFAEILDILENQLDALFLDSDALTMSGDILKAFSDAGLFEVQGTDENYITSILFDEDVLAQIENSHCLLPAGGNLAGGNAILNVTQSNQIITFTPSVSATTNDGIYPSKLVLNSHKDSPDYKDVLEWTRLITIVTPSATSAGVNLTVQSTGLEILVSYQVFRYAGGLASGGLPVNNVIIATHFGYFISSTAVNSPVDYLLSCFDWHPFIYKTIAAGGSTTAVVAQGDYKVAVSVDTDTLNKINESAVYGALYANSK